MPLTRTRSLGLILAAAAALLGIVWAWTADNQKRVDEIQAALDRHDFETADKSLQRYLQAAPKNPDAHLLAAQLARRALFPILPSEAHLQFEPNTLGSRARAEQHLALFRKHGGDIERERFERYLLRAQVGELDEVEGDLMALVRQDALPESVQIRILEALAAGNLVRYRLAEARYCLDEMLKRQPQPQGLLWRGFVHERCREPARAADDYRRCLELAPESVEAAWRLADLLRSTDSEEALRLYRLVALWRPSDPTVLLGQARCLVSLGRENEAQVTLEELIRNHPDNHGALVERARLDLGKREAAEGWLRRALEFSPHDHEANLLLYRYLELAGKKAEAKQQRARLDDIEANVNRLHEITGLAANAPHDANLRFEAGALMLCTGRDREGIRCLETALQEDPRHAAAVRLLDLHQRGGSDFTQKVHAELARFYRGAPLPDLAARHARQAQSKVP